MLQHIPQKTLYQIYLTDKATDSILLDTKVVAYSPSEAIEKSKVGSYISESGLTRETIDFYINEIGFLYDSPIYSESLALTPPLGSGDLPHSTVLAMVKSIATDKNSCMVGRIFNGKEYIIKALVTNAIQSRLGKKDGVEVGDTVLVTYLEHTDVAMFPIIVDEIMPIT